MVVVVDHHHHNTSKHTTHTHVLSKVEAKMNEAGKRGRERSVLRELLLTYDIAIDFTLDVLYIAESNRRRLVPVQAHKLYVNAILDHEERGEREKSFK